MLDNTPYPHSWDIAKNHLIKALSHRFNNLLAGTYGLCDTYNHSESTANELVSGIKQNITEIRKVFEMLKWTQDTPPSEEVYIDIWEWITENRWWIELLIKQNDRLTIENSDYGWVTKVNEVLLKKVIICALFLANQNNHSLKIITAPKDGPCLSIVGSMNTDSIEALGREYGILLKASQGKIDFMLERVVEEVAN